VLFQHRKNWLVQFPFSAATIAQPVNFLEELQVPISNVSARLNIYYTRCRNYLSMPRSFLLLYWLLAVWVWSR